MSKKLEKILDQKFNKYMEGMDRVINGSKDLKKDGMYKIVLLRQDMTKVNNDFNSMVATSKKYLDSIQRSK